MAGADTAFTPAFSTLPATAVSRLAQEGLIVDRETANLAVKRWLREIANARVHGTTGEVPAERLAIERTQLQPVPIVGLRHPLSVYDAFAGGAS